MNEVDKPVIYSDSSTEVLLGDHVKYKSFFSLLRLKSGRISYVPGISEPHPEMEHNGLTWVGVSGEDGTFRGVYVEPETGVLKKSVVFSHRSTDNEFTKIEDLSEEDW